MGKKNILYFGNKLSIHGGSVGVIETLTARFENRYRIKSASSKKNQILRMLDMIWVFFINIGKTECVLIDAYSTKAFWYCYILARICVLFKIPYIPILHGGDFPVRLQELSSRAKFVFSKSYMNLSPSLFLLHFFKEQGYKVEYFPNSVDLELYHYKIPQSNNHKILWVRAFHNIYNPIMAIDVLKIVRNKYPDTKLTMVGGDKDGSMLETKKRVTDLNLSDNVVFTGYIPKKDWILLAKDFSVFLNTTQVDNHPVSVIEAMALGLAVISTDAGGLPFLIKNGQNGLLSRTGNPEAMAENVIRVFNNQMLMINLSAEGRKSAVELSWEEVSKKWFGLLDKVAPNCLI